MVARFEPVLHEKGAWMYPRLFWETGVLGQVLYLEAHALGISATGIGCYFDDDGNFLYFMEQFVFCTSIYCTMLYVNSFVTSQFV